nr:hyphal wall protein 1-like [Halyomorpha halys]
MASLPAIFFFIVCSVGGSVAHFYLQPQSRFPFYYYQQQRGYWPDTERTQEYDNDQGFRYHQSYQNSYQQKLQYNYPFTQYQFGLPQQVPQQVQVTQEVPQVPQQVPQVAQQVPQIPQQVTPQVPQQVSQQVPQELPQEVPQVPEDLPEYQLITLGPEVPVLVKLPDQRTAILPARTVYSLPGFLEGIVQNVQNYYSVFNPLEVLKIQRNNATVLFQTVSTTQPTTGSSTESSSISDTSESSTPATSEPSSSATPEASSSSSPETPTEAAVTTTPQATDEPEADSEETTTASSTESASE